MPTCAAPCLSPLRVNGQRERASNSCADYKHAARKHCNQASQQFGCYGNGTIKPQRVMRMSTHIKPIGATFRALAGNSLCEMQYARTRTAPVPGRRMTMNLKTLAIAALGALALGLQADSKPVEAAETQFLRIATLAPRDS